jgi:hypothetical protein
VSLEIYRHCCRRGTDWLLEQLNADGSIGPVADDLYYYRVPWTFALVGEIEAASRNLEWINRNMLTAKGAFEGLTPQGSFADRYGCYPLSCLLTGAALLQRFDIVRRCTARLLTWQDAESGGFFHRYADRTPAGEQEIFPTAQAGMSLIAAGEIDAARRAGAWMDRLWSLQPEVDRRLFAVYSAARGLITEYPEEQKFLYVTEKSEPWQHHFNGGIAAAFLSHLYLATGEQNWLALARSYQDFSMTTDECQFQSMQTCKSGWGSGLLYVATGEEKYRAWAARMGDWFNDHQRDDGHWENTKFWTPKPTRSDNIHITTEFVMHVAHLISYLSLPARAAAAH